MDRTINYELEIVYTPTKQSDAQISNLRSQFGVKVENTVLPRDVDQKDKKYIEKAMQEQSRKSGFPYGIATFKPLKYEGLCKLVQASMDSVEIRVIAFRELNH